MAVMSARDGPHRLQTSLFDQLFVDTRKADYRERALYKPNRIIAYFCVLVYFFFFHPPTNFGTSV